MNLTLADLRALPLAAALVEGENDVLAHTPEWRGAGPGTVAYPVRRTRLLVAAHGAPDPNPALISLLLDELDTAAATAAGSAALRLRMLAASLRVVAGRAVSTSGSAGDVLRLAQAGIAARTGAEVHSGAAMLQRVPAPELIALVLVQFAVNAERHSGAAVIRLEHERDRFSVTCSGVPGTVGTARRRTDRERWGLGFSRIAADALGATLHPPHPRADGSLAATLELGVARLALPLAAYRGGTLLRATRAWDEETSLLPGSSLHGSARLSDLVAAARGSDGAMTTRGGWTARAARDLVWVAIPPDGGLDRARDVLHGLGHEQALLGDVAELQHARIRGLALLAGAEVGLPLPRVPARGWASRLARLLRLAGSPLQLPAFDGVGALDPDAALVLGLRAGAGFEAEGDQLWLRLSDGGAMDPVSQALLTPAGGRIALA